MKRLLLISLTTLFLTSGAPITSANELTGTGEQVFRISDTRHRDITEVFYDRSLEEKLLPTGSLGRLLIEARALSRDKRILFIDPMLIEEVQDLVDGFLVRALDGESTEEIPTSAAAIAWLEELQELTNGDEIASLNYGNPDLAFLARSAPSELRIHQRLSRQRLAELLSRGVSELALSPETSVNRRLPNFLTERFTQHRREIRSINRYAKNPETRQYRLLNPVLLNPEFPRERAFQFARDLSLNLGKYQNSIRITSGRYTLTSKNERVPVTLINDFSNDLTIKLKVLTSNSRVLIGALESIEIPAESKLPISIPIEVLSSGQSDLIISIETQRGQRIGREVRLPLNLAVISPLTTWITTGSGVILLIAAIIQSLRRIRKSRKKSEEAVSL
jgi:hypothetical protein